MTEVKLFFIGDNTPGLIKPKHFKEFALPYNKRIFDAFRDLKCIKIWHSDTDETRNLEMTPEIGSDVFHVGPSDLVDIQIVKKDWRQNLPSWKHKSPITRQRKPKSD